MESASPVPAKGGRAKKVKQFSFAQMIPFIIDGMKVRRQEWQDPEEHCLLKDNFLMIQRDGKFHTWIVSEGDLLAVDWVVVQ